MLLRRATVLAALLAAVPGLADAQSGYLFEAPRVTLVLRTGASIPMASDALHDMFTDQLTLSRRDFASPTFGGDVAVSLNPHVDLMLAVSHSRISRASSSRDWVDANDLLIEQTTRLKRTQGSLNVRLFARERGREAGKYAWVPSSFVPYVGAGVGIIGYELEQSGWFVDYLDQDIFPDFFSASGNAPFATGFIGTEWWAFSRFGLNVEGRYSYARADLKPDFTEFNQIDLSGFQVTAGFAVRF